MTLNPAFQPKFHKFFTHRFTQPLRKHPFRHFRPPRVPFIGSTESLPIRCYVVIVRVHAARVFGAIPRFTRVSRVYDGEGNRSGETAGGVSTMYLLDTLNPTSYSQMHDEVVSGSVTKTYTYGRSFFY
jgi:hypothetical protein